MVLHNGARAVRVDAGRAVRVAAMAAAFACSAGTVRAQVDPCDQLKTTLAGRLSMDPRSYTLEAVPASTALPAGAKVIGTCKGGAYKVVYRKGGGAPLVANGAGAGASAPVVATTAPRAAVVASAVPPTVPTPKPAAAAAVVPVPAPVPSRPVVPPVVAAPKPESNRPAASAVAAVRPPSAPRAASRPTAPVASAAVPVGVQARVTIADTTATEAAASDPADGWPFPAASATAAPDDDRPIGEAASAFVADHWPWVAPAIGVPLAWGLWAGWSRRRDYDSAGLPRGPRL